MSPDTSNPVRRALFADLVFNEEEQPAKVVTIGNVPHYAVPDGDFLRHVEAEYVDRQIVKAIQERVRSMRDIVTEGVIHMLGEEDLFTRPSIEHAIGAHGPHPRAGRRGRRRTARRPVDDRLPCYGRRAR